MSYRYRPAPTEAECEEALEVMLDCYGYKQILEWLEKIKAKRWEEN